MVRVMFPDGKIKNVGEIVPFCEASYVINGERRNVLDVCTSMEHKPTALELKVDSRDAIFGEDVVIGNLSSELVNDIMHDSLIMGYIDFSGMSIKRINNLSSIELGSGQAYIIQTCLVSSYHWGSPVSPFNPSNEFYEDEEGDEGDDDNFLGIEVDERDEYDDYSYDE